MDLNPNYFEDDIIMYDAIYFGSSFLKGKIVVVHE